MSESTAIKPRRGVGGGREREKVNVGVVNPLIAVRGGYTTQYSKTNTKFLHGLHLLRM